MIDSLFEILVLKSIGISALILLIVLLRPSVLRHLNAKVAYGLWMILPIYLLVPINSAGSNSSGGFMTFVLGEYIAPQSSLDENIFFAGDTAQFGLLIWGVGCFITLMLFFVRYWQLKRSLGALELESIDFMIENSDLVSAGKIKLVFSPLIDAPAVFGFFNAYLILPYNFSSLPNNNQQLILQHELYHLNRNDHRYNFARVFIKSLFWFNPLLYWADKYCEADQEISCDFGVLQNSNKEHRKAYAVVLLDTVTATQQSKLLSQWKYQSLIKERVKMLNNTKTKKWHSWMAAVFAIGAIWGTSNVVIAESEKVIKLEVIPTEIIQPRYPRKAAVEGVAGWVKFQFNVDSNGQPYEIQLIDENQPGVFGRDAHKAISQWKFEKNKKQQGLIYTMEFVLE